MGRERVSGVCESGSADVRHADDSNGFVNRRSGFRLPPLAPDSNYLESLAKKLARYVDRTPGPGKCWPWTKGLTNDGYGRLYSGNSQVLAHVAALEVKLGRRLAPGEHSLHSCDNPPCCNPDDLHPGSLLDNSAEAIARGRTLVGERHPKAKLTLAQVQEIIAARSSLKYGDKEALGRRFGVTGKQIANILNGRRWARVAA